MDNYRTVKEGKRKIRWRENGVAVGDRDEDRQIIGGKRFITSLTNAYSLLCNSHFEKLIRLTFTAP